jgi:CRISPR-associated endoribonuclease Cas6
MPAYKGSTLRGGFGHAFKKVVCVKREKVCETCLLRGKCVYSYVFETPPPPDTSKMKKYPYAPHPFVITPPLEAKRLYRENERLCFELTLVGKSIDFLPYFIYTFDELGKMGIGKDKGKYQLEEVRAINIGERSKAKGEKVIYSGKDKTLHNNYEIMKVDDLGPFPLSPSTLPLSFVTPTRLKYDGQLSPTLEFHILIRNLLRRISLLSYFHCGEELVLDFKGLIEEAKNIKALKENLHWQDWERYSNRQETKMKMGGFVGSVKFQGEFEKFIPFLLLGEYIHVGKGTSFGLGKYQILNLEY